jgi:cyclohexanecarboxylate-CoA ligase
MSSEKKRFEDSGLILPQQRIDDAIAAGLWQNLTANDYLVRAVASSPDKVFVVDNNSNENGTRYISYREIDRISRRIAAHLVTLGVERGDVVALQLPNWWEFIAIHLACVRIGAITNPLQPIFRERELSFMLAFAESKVLFIPEMFRGFKYRPMIESIDAELPKLKHVFTLGGLEKQFEKVFLVPRWEDETDTDKLIAERQLEPNEVAEICYTSGTTGQPKGVMHTYNTLVACTGPTAAFEMSKDSVALMSSPLSHQTGFLYGFLTPLMHGAKVVFQDVWDAASAARLIHDEGVTYTMGATPFLSDLSSTPAIEKYPPKTLSLFVCAGAPIPRVLAKKAAERFGARIAAGWGMSENGLVTITQPGDSDEKVFGTDGIGWQGQEVRIVDDDKNPVPNGTVGDLQTRGVANFVGYLKKPEAYGLDSDGWFDTGDIAVMDDDGYIRITSRAKDIIIRGGENVPVVEIEELLYRHPSIVDAAVVAMPDERLGEKGCAFVSLHPKCTFSFEDMREFFQQERLSKHYWPERLEVVKEFPRTPSGKIQKFVLRDLAASF